LKDTEFNAVNTEDKDQSSRLYLTVQILLLIGAPVYSSE